MKNDIQSRHDVEEELQWDPAVDASRFAVQTKNGVVTLSGGVDVFTGKYAVEEAIRCVAGVTAFVIHVDARMPPDVGRPDDEIVQVISSALHWNASVPPDTVQITIEGGTVTLCGGVDQDFQRRVALDTVRRVRGVRSVANVSTSHAASGPAGPGDHIVKAPQRLAATDVSRLNASVVNETVTSYGSLRNLNECCAVREVVWDASGMRAVVDQMRVGSQK